MNNSSYGRDLYDVIVIGGGASGMMAAAVAAENGARVLLLEKNKQLGKKLAITGGGRCNIYNAEEDQRILLANYGKSDRFLFSPFSRFGMQETAEYFRRIGVTTKIEDRKRAFPSTDSAPDVVHALHSELIAKRVVILTNMQVTKIDHRNGLITSVATKERTFHAKHYILATGGLSRPETGSTGDGFGWLKELQHAVRAPSPNVTPLAVAESWVKELSGTILKDAQATFYSEGKRAFRVRGRILITHFGLSGPVILNNAYRVAELLEQGAVTVRINSVPEQTEQQLDEEVRRILAEHPAKILKNTIKYMAPTGLAPLLTSLAGRSVELETGNSKLSRQDRLKIVDLLKNLPLTVTNLMGFEKAVVADGGLSLTDIDTRTMRSKVIDNLSVTGDLLDINRPSGGYSLQLCWTTGYLAGLDAASNRSISPTAEIKSKIMR